MNILLTGGTGFLGSNLLKQILRRPSNCITILKRSTSRTHRVKDVLNHPNTNWINIDEVQLPDIFSKNKFDIIIHCATNYGRSNTNMIDIVAANLMLPLSLLQLGVNHGVKNFINTDTIIDKRVNDYSLSKKQFLEWLQAAQGKIKCVNMAMEHFYGPFDDESKFTTMIFHKLLRNESEILLTLGEQKRHFVYIDDAINAFLCVLNNLNRLPDNFSSFEVSSEKSISIKDFVLCAQRLIGNTHTTLKFGALQYRENELMDSHTDISPLADLGWHPTTSLEDGIRKTIEEESTNEISH